MINNYLFNLPHDIIDKIYYNLHKKYIRDITFYDRVNYN